MLYETAIAAEVFGVDRSDLSATGSWYDLVVCTANGVPAPRLPDVTIRDFAVDASHNELGMDPVELVGVDVDADNDGVKNELSVGDITALTVYLAGLNRPATATELDGTFKTPLSDERKAAIASGEELFTAVGCATCHVPSLTLKNHIFTEPSQHPAYRKDVLKAGMTAQSVGLDPATHLITATQKVRDRPPDRRPPC